MAHDSEDRVTAPGAIPSAITEHLTEKHRLAVVGSLAGKLVHALNNPLTMLKANARYLAEALSDPDDVARVMLEGNVIAQEIQDAVETIEGFVAAITEYVQGDEEPCDVDLVSAAETAMAVADAKIRYSAELRLTAAERPVTVHGRSQQLQQMITGILFHLESCPADYGPCEVRVSADDQGRAILVVEDHRPQGIVAHVPDGSGPDEFDPEIGLVLAHHIAADHGALMVVDDPTEGTRRYTVVFGVPRDHV